MDLTILVFELYGTHVGIVKLLGNTIMRQFREQTHCQQIIELSYCSGLNNIVRLQASRLVSLLGPDCRKHVQRHKQIYTATEQMDDDN